MVGAYAKVHHLSMETGGSDVVLHTHVVLAREARMARMLLDAARSLGETLVPDRVYERFREILGDAVQYDGVIVSSYDAADGTIRCEYAWVDGELLAPEALPPLKLGPPGHGMQSGVIHSGRSLLTNDVAERVKDGGTYYDVDASGAIRKLPDEGVTGVTAAMMVPIKDEGRVAGVVQVMTSRATYDREQLELVEGLVAQMAAAVRNARLHGERARLEAAEAAARAVAEEREQAARVLDAVGDGIVLVDEQGVVRFWNRAAEIVTGVRAEEAVGQPAGAIFAGWRSIADEIPAAEGRSVPRSVTLPVYAGGRELWLSFVAVRSTAGIVYAFRDLTIEHGLERAKSDFIATVSHELRTPMTAVLGAAKTLLRPDLELTEEQRRELLEMIATQATRLGHVTEEVLLASRLDRGDLRVDAAPVDVDEIAGETIAAMRAQLPDGIAVELRPGPAGPAVGDRDRVQQVLVNLIDNAAKYSPSGGRVVVSTERLDEAVRVSVADQGMGIAPTAQGRVFDRFYRADPNLTHAPAGTGLGLYICRELVQRMGGRIDVRSQPGAGSTFWFDLPLR
jgi:PAS domain S-box-containing protein